MISFLDMKIDLILYLFVKTAFQMAYIVLY